MIFNVGPSGSRSIEIIANGTSYRYIGTEISNEYFKISPYGDMGWKLWIYATVDIKFNYFRRMYCSFCMGQASYGNNRNFGLCINGFVRRLRFLI